MNFLKEITPREYQKNILKTCIEKNCLVVLPTGLGKTLIALMLTIERMKSFPGQKVVFLAPTKPLAEQHLNSFKKNLGELFADIQIFTGEINATNRKKIWQTADIIFSTPQCVANDLKKNLYNLEEVCLLIEDEAHRCVKNYSYNFIAQKYKSQAKNPRILGLTASPGNEIGKIKTICKNLAIQEVEIRTRESPDVKEYLQKREFEKVQIDFPKEFEEMRQVLNKLFGEYVDEIKKRGLLYAPATKTNLIKLQKNLMDPKKHKELNELLGISACAVAIKLQHAIELLETQTLKGFNNYLKDLFEQAANKKSKGVIKLVKKTEFNFVYTKSSELLSKKLEHPKISELISLIYKEKKQNEKFKAIVFSQFRDTAQIISETMNTIDGIKSKMFIGQAKKKGFGLSQKDQKQIIIEFINGEINLLSATCIAEEGLDIPEVDAVIFYEPIPSAIRSIQRAGRTARLNKGKIIILITKNTRDESYYYVSRAREKQMNSAIETIRQDMKNKETQKTL